MTGSGDKQRVFLRRGVRTLLGDIAASYGLLYQNRPSVAMVLRTIAEGCWKRYTVADVSAKPLRTTYRRFDEGSQTYVTEATKTQLIQLQKKLGFSSVEELIEDFVASNCWVLTVPETDLQWKPPACDT